MATLREIASHAGVSISTASRALSGHEHVDPETRERVQQIAKALGYTPNAMARGLRRNQTRTIGLLIPDMRNSSFSSEAAIPLQRHLQEFGYGLVLYVSRHDHETELRCIERLQAQQVDGVIHVPVSTSSAESLTKGPRPIPVVEFLRRSGSDRLDGVLHSDEEGAEIIVNHLLQLGHRHIGIITGPVGHGSTTRRLAGARRAMGNAGLAQDHLSVVNGAFAPEVGRSGFHSFLESSRPPTAVFATSTQFVLGAALAAQELGVSIPGQVSLAGFGDPAWMQLISPQLTTYALPMEEMAMTVALLMINRIERETPPDSEPVRIMISGNLVVRGSTAPPPA